MKKLPAYILTLCFLLSTIPTASALSKPYDNRHAVLNAIDPGVIKLGSTQDTSKATLATSLGRVNVRSGPGTSYEKIDRLKKGQIVTIKAFYGDWAEISGYDQKAYVSAALFAIVPDTNSQTSSKVNSIGTAVASANVNVRSGPATSHYKIGELKKGQAVDVQSINGKWAEITWSATSRGFVHTDYLRLEMKSEMNLYTLIKSIAPGFEDATSFTYRVTGTDSKNVAETNNIVLAKKHLADVMVTGYEKHGSKSGWTKMIVVSHENKEICSFEKLGSQGVIISIPGATYLIQ